MPYIIVLVLVIAIVVVAVRKQKFDQKKETEAGKTVNPARIRDKENSIEVNDFVEVSDNSADETVDE